MRICFLGDAGSIHVRRWMEYFRDKGHEVHAITFSSASIDGVFVHKIGNFDINSNGGNWQYILKLNEIKREIKKINPDIINAHYITSYGFLAALTGIKPLVLSAWGTDILVTPKVSKIYNFTTKYSLDRSSLITSDSRFMSEEIKRLTGTEVITVPMGVEKKLCTLERKESPDEFKILSLRTINKNSNIDIIVKAVSRLVNELSYKNVRLIITNDGPEMDNIKKLVDEFNLNDNVDIRGFVKREELIELLLSSQAYISIPASDSTSVTLLEAMACGTMCIVSDIPANNEWIRERENGILFDGNDPAVLADCIINACKDKDLRDKTIKISRKIICEKALWEDNMSIVENKYLNIAGRYQGVL